jgi:hypothetical protein
MFVQDNLGQFWGLGDGTPLSPKLADSIFGESERCEQLIPWQLFQTPATPPSLILALLSSYHMNKGPLLSRDKDAKENHRRRHLQQVPTHLHRHVERAVCGITRS